MTSTNPAIRLRLLGGATLEGPDGPAGGRSAQRRRIALLAILAMARRPVSRDRIIGLLWEESSTDRARKLLSESIYVIRKAVGENSLVATGDDLRLDPDVVWCDAAAFEDAADRDDPATAANLYRGPFMDGFFIGGAPEFERWMDGVRDGLARRQAEALTRLATRSTEIGDYRAALPWWRRLTEHDGFNATYALGLMRALDETGDRAGAIQHGLAHAARLRAELDADADPSVEALLRQLRESPDTRGTVAAPATVTPVATAVPPAPSVTAASATRAAPNVGITTEPFPPDPQSHAARSSTWRVWSAIAVSALLSIAVFVTVFVRRNDAPPAPRESALVAVFPFAVHGNAVELREGMVDLLSTNLDGAGDLRSVDPHALLSHIRDNDEVTLRRAAALSKRLGATLFVLGDATEAGDQLQLNATLYAVDGDTALTRANARGPSDSLLVLVDRVATQLVAARGVTRDELTQLAVMTTRSYPALKAYLEGENHYRAARYQAAVRAFTRAISIDPGFALADYRLSAAAEWSFDFLLSRRAARRALENSERLPAHYRPLVRAWLHFLNGNAAAGRREYEAILVNYPNDVEANSGLGEIMTHFNPSRGLSSDSARGAFARVLAAAPAFGEVRFHEMEFAVRDRNLARFDSLLATLDSANRHFLPWHAVRAYTWGTAADQQALLQSLSRADELVIGMAAGRVAAHAHNMKGARAIVLELNTATRSEQWRAGGQLLDAELLAASGRFDDARRVLHATEAMDQDWPIEIESLLVLHPLANAPPAVVDSQYTRLLQWSPGSHSPSTTFFLAAHATVHRHLREYLLGMTAAKAGRLDDANAHRGALAQLRGDPDAEAFGAALARSLDGHIARARGDRARALELLTTATIDAPPEFLALSPFYSRAHDRLTIANINLELGNYAEAARWYGTLLEGFDFMYADAARRGLAEISGRGS